MNATTDNGTQCRVLRIDAWREAGGGWTWNSWHNMATVPAEWCDLAPRALLRKLRDAGIIRGMQGELATEDDGHNIVIIYRGTREPLLALEYGAVAIEPKPEDYVFYVMGERFPHGARVVIALIGDHDAQVKQLAKLLPGHFVSCEGVAGLPDRELPRVGGDA